MFTELSQWKHNNFMQPSLILDWNGIDLTVFFLFVFFFGGVGGSECSKKHCKETLTRGTSFTVYCQCRTFPCNHRLPSSVMFILRPACLFPHGVVYKAPAWQLHPVYPTSIYLSYFHLGPWTALHLHRQRPTSCHHRSIRRCSCQSRLAHSFPDGFYTSLYLIKATLAWSFAFAALHLLLSFCVHTFY